MQFRCNTVQYRVAPKRLLDIQNSRMRTVVAIHIALLARHAAPTSASIPFGSTLPTATRPAIRRPQAKQSDGHRPNNPTATGLANRRAQAMSPFNFLYCILMVQGSGACLTHIGDRVSFSKHYGNWRQRSSDLRDQVQLRHWLRIVRLHTCDWRQLRRDGRCHS